MELGTKSCMAAALASALLIGCGGQPASEPAAASSGGGMVDTAPPPTVGAHAHPSEGPHHGELIELGAEEYHAELLHDASSVTIYILDGAAKAAVPIEAKEVTINLKHDGNPEQFVLAASPDAGDPAGKSSRFVSKDAELAGHMEEAGADARLVATINGKQFNGAIVHDHGHTHSH